MSEKFNLKWNDFQSNVSRSFGLFRNESYLHDVTLVSDDLKKVQVHKLVLSACSEYFKTIFQETKQSQPILCLDGVSSSELQNVLDYVYEGEVKILQEDLDRFLNVAQRLKLEGLMGNDEDVDKSGEGKAHQIKDDEYVALDETSTQLQQKPIQTLFKTNRTTTAPIKTVALTNDSFNLEEHKEKLKEQVITNDDRSVSCKICGKTTPPNQNNLGKARSNMRNHVEIHFEGLSYPCPSCDKTFRYVTSVAHHKARFHN